MTDDPLIDVVAHLVWAEGHYSIPWDEWQDKERWRKVARGILAAISRHPGPVVENRCLACDALLTFDGDRVGWWVHSKNMSTLCPVEKQSRIIVPDRLY